MERWLRGIAGAVLLASLALGYYHNSWWLLLTAFMALSMVQSAISNWCPLERVLMRLDLSRSQRVEREKQALEQQLEHVLRVTRTGLDIIDADHNVRYVDPVWQERLGDPTGRKCYDYFMARSEACPGCPVRWVLETKTRVVSEGVLPREDDRPVRATTIPFQSDTGEWLCAEINVDISQYRDMEERVRQAQHMEAVGVLAGGVAHDFNNLLTGIIGYSSLIEDGTEPGTEPHSEAGEVRRLALRASDLTSQLLAFSRRQPLELVALDLNELIGGFLKMLQRLLGDGITVEFRPGEELATVRVDRGQIEQVLVNLAVNARDAMPDGGALTIRTSNAPGEPVVATRYFDMAPGSCVAVTVADTGCGMDEETRRNVFEPFFTTKRRGEGTGLGLATAYGIVKQHRGDIRVESTPGEGTTFTISLPCEEGEPAAICERTQGETGAGGSETILVVDDEDGVRTIVERLLTSRGYRIVSAVSAEDALQKIDAHGDGLDLLLTDVVMPGASGKELCEALRATRPGLSVIYMSGYADDVIGGRCSLDDNTLFIAKPFSPDRLFSKVREILDAAG
jgi:signal transduction histidine kinase